MRKMPRFQERMKWFNEEEMGMDEFIVLEGHMGKGVRRSEEEKPSSEDR